MQEKKIIHALAYGGNGLSGLQQVVGICGSYAAFAALKSDGTVATWGSKGRERPEMHPNGHARPWRRECLGAGTAERGENNLQYLLGFRCSASRWHGRGVGTCRFLLSLSLFAPRIESVCCLEVATPKKRSSCQHKHRSQTHLGPGPLESSPS